VEDAVVDAVDVDMAIPQEVVTALNAEEVGVEAEVEDSHNKELLMSKTPKPSRRSEQPSQAKRRQQIHLLWTKEKSQK